MKIKCLLFLSLFGFGIIKAKAQTFEVEQLILDWQKLSELKNILSEMKTGYQILSTGYETIRSISERNFNLHNAFLSALLAINPAVKNYKRVADIINYQAAIVSEYKSAFNRFKQDKHFTPDEISYLGTVYGNLFNQSLSDITNLSNVLSANKMRMSDDERLHSIDGIYDESKNKLMFLRSFNNSTTLLAIDRATEQNDADSALQLYGLE
jgi:DNA repair ATPase RecN